MSITREQLLVDLPEEIAEEFREFVGDDEARKQMLLDNYRAKQKAFANDDPDALEGIINDEAFQLP